MADRVIYAVRLVLAGDLTSDKNYLAARALTKQWIGNRHDGWPPDIDITNGIWEPSHGERVCTRVWAGDAGKVSTFTWDTPHDDPTLLNRSTITIVDDTFQACVTIQQAIGPQPDAAAMDFVQFEAKRPHLACSIVDKMSVVDGARLLTPGPWKTSNTTAVADLIKDPTRRLPVIVCARNEAGERTAPVDGLADTCIGLAHIVDLQHPDDRRNLGFDIGRRHEPHEAAMRLYWPGWHQDDRPHPGWDEDQMVGDQWGNFAHRFAKRLYAVAGFRIHPPASAERIRAEIQHARIAALNVKAAKSQVNAEMLAEWESDLDRLAKAQNDLNSIRGQLRDAATEIEDLKATVKALRARPTFAEGTGGDSGTPEVPSFTNVSAMVAYAQRHLTHLTFNQRAIESAAQCVYRWPNRIYDDLAVLNEVAERWMATGRLDQGWAGEMRSAGVPWGNDIGEIAKTRYAADYRITLPDGTKVLLGPHIKRGAATGPEGHIRIYLHIDNATRHVTVGWIGRHLRDQSNTG